MKKRLGNVLKKIILFAPQIQIVFSAFGSFYKIKATYQFYLKRKKFSFFMSSLGSLFSIFSFILLVVLNLKVTNKFNLLFYILMAISELIQKTCNLLEKNEFLHCTMVILYLFLQEMLFYINYITK